MKITYWDDSALMVKDGYPVALKIPLEFEFEWLTTTMMDAPIVLNVAKAGLNKMVWKKYHYSTEADRIYKLRFIFLRSS